MFTHSTKVSAISLLVLTACGDGSNSSITDAYGVNGQSYCDSLNQTFSYALRVHLTKTRKDAPAIYTNILHQMVNRNFAKGSRSRNEIESQIFDSEGNANVENLKDCKDIAAIQNAANKNPMYFGAETENGSDGNIDLEVSQLADFLRLLGPNLDFHSSFEEETRYFPRAGMKLFNYGVRLDVDAAEIYSVKSLTSVRVAAVRDPKSDLKAGDKITAIYRSPAAKAELISNMSPSELDADSDENPFNVNPSETMEVELERVDNSGKSVAMKVKIEGVSLSGLVQRAPIVSGELHGDVAYVRLFEFGDSSALELTNLINNLKMQWEEKKRENSKSFDSNKELGIILDLRFNGGGRVQDALQILGLFIGYQRVGSIEAMKDGILVQEPIYSYSNGTRPIENPLMIMVNHRSASASELVAVTLQDLKRATIIGKRTFGKGIGQSSVPVSIAGRLVGELSLTRFRTFSPSGENIQMKGRIPDIDGIADSTHEKWYAEKIERCDKKEFKTMRTCVLRMEDWNTRFSQYKSLNLTVSQARPIGRCGTPVETAPKVADLNALLLGINTKPGDWKSLNVPNLKFNTVDEVKIDEATSYTSKLMSLYLHK